MQVGPSIRKDLWTDSNHMPLEQLWEQLLITDIPELDTLQSLKAELSRVCFPEPQRAVHTCQ